MSLISEFISDRGKILSRRATKLTLKQQRAMALAIKQARILSSLPFLTNNQSKKSLEKFKPKIRKKNARGSRKKFVPRGEKKFVPRGERKFVPKGDGSGQEKK